MEIRKHAVVESCMRELPLRSAIWVASLMQNSSTSLCFQHSLMGTHTYSKFAKQNIYDSTCKHICTYLQSICGTYLWYVTWLVPGCVCCKLFIGACFWCAVDRSPSMAHHGEISCFQLLRTILRQPFSMNVTPISLVIARYPIIIKYPNAAHIPFSQIPFCYPKYSTMYPCTCMGGTWD